MTEHEMVGWHHQLNSHEFEQTLGDNEGKGSLVCCSPWGHKVSDKAEQLNKSMWPPLHVKAINLWFSTLPKTLPHRIQYWGTEAIFYFITTVYPVASLKDSQKAKYVISATCPSLPK